MSGKKKMEERLLDVFEVQARVHATLSGLMLFITETHSICVKNFKFRLKTEKNVYLHF